MAQNKFYNLSEMSRLTGINRAQLHKYVRTHGSRIPSSKMGKRTVFPIDAATVFEEIRIEGLRAVGKKITSRKKSPPGRVRRRVGRPPLSDTKRPPDQDQFMSLSAMARHTGINRVQLHKYVRDHRGRIPSKRIGKRTVFPLAAAEIFHEIREEGLRSIGKSVGRPTHSAASSASGLSLNGRPASGGKRHSLEQRLASIEQALDELRAAINRPIVVSIERN